MKSWVLVTLAVLTTGCHRHQGSIIPITQPQVFLLMGQSNMEGKAPVESSAPDNRIKMMLGDKTWAVAQDPLDHVDTSFDGHGPGMAFARALLRHRTDMPIELINCSVGGTGIDQWQPGLGLYGRCAEMVVKAVKTDNGHLAGVLYFQGESDAAGGANPEWTHDFENIVNDLHHSGLGNFPIIFAQIGSTTDSQMLIGWSGIQAQQAAISLPGVYMIKTSDLAIQDTVHFTGPSYDEVGLRYANMFWDVAGDQFEDKSGVGTLLNGLL